MFCFSRERPLLARGKILLFRDNNGYKQRLGPPVRKRRQFCDLSSWVRVFKWSRKREEKKPEILLNISLTANNHFWYCCPFFASDLMHNSTGYVIKQLIHTFSCALSSYGYRLSPRATLTQTSRVLHNSIVHAKAWTNLFPSWPFAWLWTYASILQGRTSRLINEGALQVALLVLKGSRK